LTWSATSASGTDARDFRGLVFAGFAVPAQFDLFEAVCIVKSLTPTQFTPGRSRSTSNSDVSRSSRIVDVLYLYSISLS